MNARTHLVSRIDVVRFYVSGAMAGAVLVGLVSSLFGAETPIMRATGAILGAIAVAAARRARVL